MTVDLVWFLRDNSGMVMCLLQIWAEVTEKQDIGRLLSVRRQQPICMKYLIGVVMLHLGIIFHVLGLKEMALHLRW